MHGDRHSAADTPLKASRPPRISLAAGHNAPCMSSLAGQTKVFRRGREQEFGELTVFFHKMLYTVCYIT